VRVWTEPKNYYFSINSTGDRIYFKLKVQRETTRLEGSASGGINGVDFTINDFNENRERTERVINRLMDITSEKDNDLVAKLIQDRVGISGYQVDYQKFYENGLEVYKSDVHQTETLRIITDQKIGRDQRTIPISEFEGQFDDYTIVYDEQLNFYVQEKISISSVTEEIVSLVKQYNGDGILDLEVIPEGETIYTTFSIVKSEYEQTEPKGQDS
jgi:hypothetical protein